MYFVVKKEKQMSGRVGGWGWDQFTRRNTYVRYRSDMPMTMMGVRAEDAPPEQNNAQVGVPLSEVTRQAEALAKLGLKFVPENKRPKSPCTSCGNLVVAGCISCKHCGFTPEQWSCNSCGGKMEMTLIGLLFCVQCKGFWQ